jgi:GH35 family endo-1,4-beta-xylanase
VKEASVHISMQRHAFGFGSAVSVWYLTVDSEDGRKYRETVRRLYNKVTFHGALRWWNWERSKTGSPESKWNIARTFKALEWLRQHNIEVRGHYVSLGPIKNRKRIKKPKIFRERLFQHIEDKIPTLGNRIAEWDVINHPVFKGRKINTLWNVFGFHIYVDIVKRTKALNPDARLYVNEGRILVNVRKNRRNAYKKIIRHLKRKGAPIDGIGFMGHFMTGGRLGKSILTSPVQLWKILDDFARFGLPIQITEFDISFERNRRKQRAYTAYTLSAQDLKLQANYMRDFMTLMFSHPAVEGIVMWGFWEGRHWYPSAALYRKDWSIKPNGQVWEDLVTKKWWTDVKGKTNTKGTYRTRGFLGNYSVTVTIDSQRKTFLCDLTKEGVHLEIGLETSFRSQYCNRQ